MVGSFGRTGGAVGADRNQRFNNVATTIPGLSRPAAVVGCQSQRRPSSAAGAAAGAADFFSATGAPAAAAAGRTRTRRNQALRKRFDLRMFLPEGTSTPTCGAVVAACEG